MTATRRSPGRSERSSRGTSTTSGRSRSTAPAKRSTSSSRPSPKRGAAAKKGARSAPTQPTLAIRATRTVARATAGHRVDLAGLAAIGVGVLAGLGVYGDGGGPLGRGLARGVATLVGQADVLVPPALVALGILAVVVHHRRAVAPLPGAGPAADPTVVDGSTHALPAADLATRLLGAVVVLLATLGLLHVAADSPALGDTAAVRDAGGWLGGALAQPLTALTGRWGGVLLLGLLVVGGLLLVTRAHLGAVLDGLRRHLAPLARRLWSALQGLFQVGGGTEIDLRDGATTYTGSAALYDQDADQGSVPDEPATHQLGAEPDPAPAGRRRRGAKVPVTEAGGDPEQLSIALGPAAEPSPWKLPPANLLARSAAHSVDRRAVEETGRNLERALAEHGVETRLVGMTVGPTVTRYELELGPGVKVARVTALHKDIAYALAAMDVRILAPIPGRSAIGVEVPNASRKPVTLGDLLTSAEAHKATHPLEVGVGKDIAGRTVMMNLATTPHLLIAGATGAGKSSGLNCMLTSLLMRTTPDQVRLILIDPKQVEMGQYGRLPHLLTQPVTDPKKAANALAWAVREMERRYDLLAELGYRDITGYNAAVERGEIEVPLGSDASYERLSFIVVVVDELNDLMMVAARDVEESITRIAQKARAVGIHLILATQRPSVNVITGVIKANIPARMAFAVSSLTDSRVILDQPGAERLLGRGDLLLLPGGTSVPQRIQGAWVGEDEVRKIVAFWRKQAPEAVPERPEVVADTDEQPGGAAVPVAARAPYDSGDDIGSSGRPPMPAMATAGATPAPATVPISLEDDITAGPPPGSTGGDDDDEALVRSAMELVVRSQLGSTSMLQRKLRIGFARAGRVMDLLEQRGVVGPSEGSKARAVLMTPEELDQALR